MRSLLRQMRVVTKYGDLAVLGAICVAAYVVALQVSVFDSFANFVQRNERLKLDGLLSLVLVLPPLFLASLALRYRELRRTKKALQQSEAQYRYVVETIHEGIWILDADSRTTYANPRMAEMVGCSLQEMLGQPVSALLDDVEGSPAANDLARCLHGEIERCEVTLRRTDGTPLPTLLVASPLVDDAGRYIGAVAMVSDLTSLRQVEAQRAGLTALVESSDHAIIGERLDGTITSWNAGAERLYGYGADEAIGQSLSMLVSLDRGDELRAMVGSAAQGEPARSVETRHRPKSGAIVDVSLTLSPVRGSDGSIRGVSTTARDITAQKRAEQALRQSEVNFRLLFIDSPLPMAVFDVESLDFLQVNKAAVRDFGYSEAEWLAMRWPDIRADSENPPLPAASERNRLEGPLVEPRKLRHKDGRIVAVEFFVHRMPFGSRRAALVVAQDITERLQAAADRERHAFTDSLTGLPNRLLFTDRLKHALVRRYSGRGVAVLYLDLDNFKVVNDSLGHDHGDALLCTIAANLQSAMRAGDTLARFGGDEFIALLDDVQDAAQALDISTRLLDAVRQPSVLADRLPPSTCSVGIAFSASRQTRSAEDLLRDADTAMYQAKARGKNQAVLFEPAMRADVLSRLDLEGSLRKSLQTGDFELYYQPIVVLDSGKISEVEALVRWRHPTRGLVAPGEFIPLAEEIGLIVPLGYWILYSACHQAARWNARASAHIAIGVNISARQFLDPRLIDQILATLAESGLAPHLLKLEVTEGVLMDNIAAASARLQVLQAYGVRVAIDDFGTGYSSLSYLKQLPVETLKIDKSFVDGIPGDPKDAAIVRTIIELAKGCNLSVTAEGIEAPAQVAFLKKLGCERGQGYLFSKPLPAALVEPYLVTGSINVDGAA